ncbi:prominin-1-A-like [Ptychodera flava]|uniref:prominin-1-A-like n=1 Tax=Ptychodera flava TaxID=63121 RepID=UPI003969D0FE
MTLQLHLSCTLFLCLVAMIPGSMVRAGSENYVDGSGNITWKDLPTGEPYYCPDEYDEGEPPLPTTWKVVNTWIKTISPGEIPYDLINDAIGGELDMNEIEMSELINLLLGFAICFAIGLLFAIIFPIVACCFCSCRLCCGRCGGRMYQKQTGNMRCKLLTFSIILAIITAMLAACFACAYHVNARQSSEIADLGDNIDNNIDDLMTFVNNTVDEILFVAVNQTIWVIDTMVTDLLNVGTVVGVPVREKLRTLVDPAIDAILTMTEVIEDTRDGLDTMNILSSYLDDNYTTFSASLDTLAQDIESMYSDCATAGGCSAAGEDPQIAANTTQLVASRNFSDLPLSGAGPGYYPRIVVTVKSLALTNVVNNDLDASAKQGQQEFEDIPEMVENETISASFDLQDSYGDFSDEVEQGLDPMIENLNSALEQGSSLGDTMSEQLSQFADYEGYLSIAMKCLYLIILAVIVLNTLGLIFGFIGCDLSVSPTERGFMSNCGGLFLMSSAGLCFIFATLFMVLTALPFIIGGPIHKLVCEPAVSGDLFENTIDLPDAIPGTDGYFLSGTLFDDGDIPLTMSGIISDCEEEMAAFTAFKLENMVNLTDMLNVDAYISKSQFSDLKVNISDQIQVMSSTTRDNLADARDANAASISWTDYENELSSDLIDYGEDLDAFADDLQTYIDAHSGDSSVFPGSHESIFTAMVTTIRDFQTDTVDAIVSERDTVKSTLAEVQSDADEIETSVNNTIEAGNNADDYIDNNLNSVIADEVNTFMARLFGYTTQFINYVDYMIYFEIGNCRPMANLIKNLLNTVCRSLLDPFNAFWFCNGWCAVFFVPNIIFCVRLAKFFRRMEEADEMVDEIPLVSTDGESNPPLYGHNRVAPHEDDFAVNELQNELKNLDNIPSIIAGENMSKSKEKCSTFRDLPPIEPRAGQTPGVPSTSNANSGQTTPSPNNGEKVGWYEVPDAPTTESSHEQPAVNGQPNSDEQQHDNSEGAPSDPAPPEEKTTESTADVNTEAPEVNNTEQANEQTAEVSTPDHTDQHGENNDDNQV